MPYYNLAVKQMAFNSYVVGFQYDCPRPEICEQRLVLNESVIRDRTDHFIPHWPHPTLKPRDRSRGTKVETVVFKGSILNLAEPFRKPSFTRQLQALQVNLTLSSEDQSNQFQDWSDYA
ncbi:hypothetical protein, partial [Corallococcus praedator]|uniref:hypothetical protein n=1 Tax=Corallococcus praedator TaxID=2316724 RepID=UPI001ABF0346